MTMQNRIIILFLLTGLMTGCSSLPMSKSSEMIEHTESEKKDTETKVIDIPRPRFNAKAEQLFEMANGLRNKDMTRASELYLSAITADPMIEPAYYNYGKLNHEQENYAAIESVIELAVINSINSARLYNLYATALRQQGQFVKAKDYYTKALSIEPSYAPGLLNMAILSDIYLQELTTAQEYYLTYQALVPRDGVEANQVKNWLADLNLRLRKQAGENQ